MRALPEAVLRVTRRQHGLVTRRQLLAIADRLGLTAKAVDAWVRRGHLERVRRGVFRLAGCPRPHEQDALAKILRAGKGARADGVMTCAFFGIEGFDLARTPGGVLIPRGRRVIGADFPVRATALPRGHLATVESVPALTPTRAMVEYAIVERGKPWRIAFDSARRRGLTAPHRLLRCARDLGGAHPGALACVKLVTDPWVVGRDSEAERDLPWLVHGIEPVAEWQVEQVLPGRRFDFGWRDALFFVEYDGRDHHVLPTDRDNDGLRDLEAAERGIQVLRITAGMLREQPDRTRAMIVRILRRRLAEQDALRRTER